VADRPPARLSRRAEAQFEAILGALGDPARQAAAIEALSAAAVLLGRHPEVGAPRRDLVDAPYRVWWCGPGRSLVLVYNPERTPPLIVAVARSSTGIGRRQPR
jgi:plasmid stabilization system protein ParE